MIRRKVRSPRAVNDREHEDPGAAVIFAVHPSDGHEVRKLPEKQNGEEDPGSGGERAAGGGPADQRGQRAGDGSYGGGEGGARLERSVGAEVGDAGE